MNDDLLKAYRLLHRECLRMMVASSDAEDGAGRVSAPIAAWKAMGNAMEALPDSEKGAVMLALAGEEVDGMAATVEKLAVILAGRRLS
jgi:hypothetical protein